MRQKLLPLAQPRSKTPYRPDYPRAVSRRAIVYYAYLRLCWMLRPFKHPDQFALGKNMTVHCLEQVLAVASRAKIQHLVQRENFEMIEMRRILNQDRVGLSPADNTLLCLLGPAILGATPHSLWVLSRDGFERFAHL
jgi:hypothetical protein